MGDVFYHSENLDNLNDIISDTSFVLFVREKTTHWRDSITAVEYYNDSLTYTFDRLAVLEVLGFTPSSNNPTTIVDTLEDTFGNQLNYVYDRVINPAVYRSIYGYSHYGNFKHVYLNPNSFSLNEETASVVSISETLYRLNTDGCLGSPNFYIGSTQYHTELGQIYVYLADDCCIDNTWSLDVYQKGDQLFTPFVELNPVYDISDSPVSLINEYHHATQYEIIGPAIEDGVFYPAFVPDSLLNQPFEFTFRSGLYEATQTIAINGSREGLNEIDSIFYDNLWLSDYVNPWNCNGDSLQVFERGVSTYFYLTDSVENGTIIQNYSWLGPTITCEDSLGTRACLIEKNLTNPVSTWSCNNISLPTSIFYQQAISQSFNIYPNPTTGKVWINFPEKANYQIKLINISGKVMKQTQTNRYQKTTEINVGDLPKGIYLIELKNEQTKSIQKLIIE